MRAKLGVRALLLGIVGWMMMGLLPLRAQEANPVIFPTGLDFGYVPVEGNSVQTISVYNVSGSKSITLNSITASIKQLKVITGTVPITLGPGQREDYGVQFTPTATGAYAGHFTFAIAGEASQAVNTNGVGASTTAIPTLSTTSMSFLNQALGSSSKPQTLTITNTGTTSFQVTNVVVTYPFAMTGWTAATSIAPGKSLKLTIGYVPTAIGSQTGLISLTYDIAAPNGVSLWGSGTNATVLGINTFPTLPAGTPKYPYQDNLFAVGGKAPYTWTLATGSTLPTGLSLSTSGLITGSLASTVSAGNYMFTARVTDSSSVQQKASKVFTLPVAAYSGYKNCNNISVNAGDGSGPLVPINDLGTNYYLGAEEGGLYANGSNVDDPGHDSYGQSAASAIVPLDGNGNYSPTGKYVFISVGLSVAQQPWFEFVDLVNTDPSKNPNLVVVNGATGGATASLLASPTNNFWNAITYDYLPNAGVTPLQVVGAWILDVDGGPAGTFPHDMVNLQSQLQEIAQNLQSKFPNIKLAYYSSMNYTGYSDGAATLNPEPYAYESGFAVKNAIQDQISGDPAMNFNPALGTVYAPWLAWGPYYWANGMIPRSDQLTWSCQDLYIDGTHPSDPSGRIKVSTELLNFLKTDDTASKWFLAH
ncbi:MAG TPA: choice-of-anchor D domain-containing protein [Candidatus Sulfotelmatobacter sp.]|jgi:hypothetical protein